MIQLEISRWGVPWDPSLELSRVFWCSIAAPKTDIVAANALFGSLLARTETANEILSKRQGPFSGVARATQIVSDILFRGLVKVSQDWYLQIIIRLLSRMLLDLLIKGNEGWMAVQYLLPMSRLSPTGSYSSYHSSSMVSFAWGPMFSSMGFGFPFLIT